MLVGTAPAAERQATLVAAILFGLVTAGSALAVEDAEAVEAAREGLSGWTSFPWYDEAEDQITLVEIPARKPPPKIRDWQWEPSQRRSSQSGWWQGWQWLAWMLLAGLLVLTVVLIIRAVLELRQNRNTIRIAGQEPSRGTTDAERVEKLPFEVRRRQTDLLGEARRHYQAGNYGEAIVYLFAHQLVYLDRSHLVRLAKGKTNRQYLKEIPFRRQFVTIFQQTMVAFEDVFFGRHALDRVRFEACWNQLDEFHRDADQAAEH